MRTNNKFFEIVTVLVLVTSIVCFDLPRVILLSEAANATSIGGGPGERDDMDHQAEWQLTRYKVTGFSLFDHGFENGQHLHLGIDTMKDGERIKVNCNQDIDFILGSNQELSIRLKVVGPIESLCGCLDSLELFAHSGDGEGEGEEGELNITVNVTDQTTSNGMAQEFFKEVVLLSALNMPVLRSISPTRGPFDVETNVTLSVEPMTAASCHHLICRFQGEGFQMDIPIAALSKDCGKIVCPVPPAFHHSRRGGYVLVGLSDGEKASNLVHFFHENNEAVRTLQSETTVLKTVGMVVTEIFPVSGPTTGGSSILFIGVSYVDNPNIRCKFGNRNAHARWISSSEVECISPRHPSSGFVNVSLDMGEDFATSAGVKFLYYNDPIILKFSPQVGPVVGGIQVTVFVDSVHESDDLVCRFGLVAVPARYLNASATQCNLPPNRAGESVSISISRNSGHDYSPFSKDSLRYLSSPTIDDVSPLFVRKGRRTKLKIRGTGFQPYGILATSARCVFGENVTMVVPTYFRSEEIHCSTPLSSVTGSIPFHVTIGEDGSIKSDTSICYYVEDYRIRSIAPDYSHTAGGSQIMLWGENLIEADTIVCKLGESLVNATFAGLNEILCIAPPNPPGDEPLFISFDGENFDETGHFVRYSDNDNHPVDGIPNPISEVEEHTSVDNEGDVIVVTPIVEEVLASGFDSLPNGTLGVTIIGNNFVKSPDLSCNISLKRGIVIWISQYQIECHAVLPRSQKLDVSVSNDGISFVNTSFASSGQRSFSIYTTQHIAATRRIVVRGSLFTKISTWICVVNKHRVVAEIVDKNELICTLPPSVHTAQISLCVCQDDLYCTEDMELMIVNQISIYNAAPLSGSLNGGTRVQFRMMHDIGPDAKCRFGRYDVEIVKADDRDTFYCVAPLVHSPKKVELLVSLDGKHFSASQLMFSFLPPITLLKLYPLRIQARQTASTLRVYGSGFVNLHSMICNFDDDVWSRALWVSDTEIWCSVPKLEPGLAQVSLSYDDSTKSENTLALTIVDHSVQVTSIFPLCGPVGTKLKVCGTNLNLITDGYCHFGEEVVPSQFDEPSCVRCLTPFREPGQKTNIALSSNGFISSQAGTVFTVIPVILQSFMPAQVEMDRRGVKFTVVGAGFECLTPDTFCRIGNVTSDSVAISSSTLLSCTFDRLGVSGIHQLTLLNSYFEVLSETSPLKIIVSPEIYSINPRWLVEGAKNNVLEIRGKNLKGSNFTCFIGGQSSTEAIVTGDDRALCVVDRCHNGVNKVHVSNDGVQISQSSQAIQCFAPSVIDRIHPIFGLSGTVIDIIGVNLRNESQCFFGSDVVSAHFINSTYLQCQIPSRFGEWNTTLRIKVDDREISLIENEFIFTMVDLGIISVSPNHGSVRGGTQVTIELEKGLSSHISHCWFDRTCVPATPASSGNQVTCITPPQNSTGIARVGLSTNGQDSTDNDVIFEYMDDIRIHSVEPARVSEIGGAMMSIHGSDFPNTRNLGCIVGEIYISADWVSENVVQCMLPALVPGDYRIGMSSNGIDQVFTPEGSRPLRIFHSITLTRVLPAVGKITGNTKIVLHGTNFFSSSGLACKFGSVLTKAAFLSSNKINCWTPAWPATENANLVVSISGQISSNHVIFRFIDPFDFFEMKPRYIFLEGGTIAVSGNGPFEEHDEFECLIGEQVIVGKLRGDNTVVCESPRNNAGTVIPVSIRYGQGDIFPIRNGQLTYFKRGNFTSTQIMPTSSLGTNRVLFHGANLSDHYKNGVFCRGPKGNFTPGVITGSSDIFCDVTAFGSSEIVRIEVSHSKDGELVESLLVKMNNAFQFSSSSPNTGLVRRPHLVSIVGNGFLTIHLVECRFDSRVFVPAHIINSTLMQCLMPMQSTVGAARLDITVNRHQILSPFSKLHFTFVDPQVASIRPSHGSVRGGTQVTIELEKGLSSHISHCWFDRTCVPATPASSGNQVTCITPPQNSTGIARVGLSTNGQDSTDNDVIFEYMDDIRIHSVEPARVSEIGGAMMSIHGSDFPNTRNLGCIVGEIYISADWVSENVVQCMLPALVPGDYRIEVTNADRSCNSETHLKVYPEFLVNSYSITARANIFYVDLAFTRLVNSYIPGISCQIGDDIIPSFFLKDNLLSCEVPFRIVYQSNKSFQLHLLIDGEESPTSPGVFDMLLPPVILTVDPTRVHSRGAILVTIFGAFENYANITLHHGLCQFGTMTTSMNGVSNMTNVQCKVPGHHKGGQVGLSISFDGGQNWSNSVPFELLPPVQIKSVYPTKVPSNGGVTISVGLDHCEPRMKLRCIFGASIEYLAIWVSTSMIQCISPPQSPGLMSLALVNNMEHIVGENITIYVHGAPRIHTLYPRFGIFTGGTQVRIIGRELDSLQEPFCFFGKSRSRASIIGPGSLLCTTPVMGQTSNVSVSIIDVLASFEWLADFRFEYTKLPHISSVTYDHSTNTVILMGKALNSAGKLWCRFDETNNNTAIAIMQANQSQALCPLSLIPSLAAGKSLFVQASNNEIDWTPKILFHTQILDIYVKKVWPVEGSIIGGTVVVIDTEIPIFDKGPNCFFGKIAVSPIVVSQTRFQCISPRFNSLDDVSLTFGYGQEPSRHEEGIAFTLQPPCTIHHIAPRYLSIGDRDPVTIMGTNFIASRSYSCFFGAVQMPALRLDSSTLHCTSPMNGIGSIRINVVSNIGDECLNDPVDTTLMYIEPAIISEIVPNIIPVTSAVNITIFGQGFNDKVHNECILGNILVKAIFQSSTEVICLLPKIETSRRGLAVLRLHSSKSQAKIRTVLQPHITSVTPSRIGPHTNETLDIVGNNFLNTAQLKCAFGNQRHLVPAQWISSERVLCKTPALASDEIEHEISFSISVNDGYHYTNICKLSRRATLQLLSIDNLLGFVSSKLMLRVDVLGLEVTENYQCEGKYWRVQAEILNGGKSIQCVLPKQDERTQVIKLTGGHQSVLLGDAMFSGKPEILSLSPLHGFKSETYVELSGTNLDHVRFCVFQKLNEAADVKQIVKILHVYLGAIACHSPPSVPGDIFSVDVSADGFNVINTEMIFQHRHSPEIQSFEPAVVPHGQRNKITITGRYFVDSNALSCSFDTESVHAHFVSSREIFCMSPKLQPGSAKISISSNSAYFVNAPIPLHVYLPIEISQIIPKHGNIDGSDQVVLSVTNALSYPGLFRCRFGLQMVLAHIVDMNSIACYSPKVHLEGSVPLSLTINGVYFHDSPDTFMYVRQPTILRIRPNQGSMIGGTSVRLHLDAMISKEINTIGCYFGPRQRVNPSLVGKDFVDCISPPADLNVNMVKVSLHYSVSEHSSFQGPDFVYMLSVSVVQIYPLCGSTEGGTEITVTGNSFPQRQDLMCLFGETSTPAEFISDQVLRCKTPEYNEPGAVQVGISTFDRALVTYQTAGIFQYMATLRINGIYPSQGSFRGGTEVVVKVSMFSNVCQNLVSCQFGDFRHKARVISPEEVRCISPPLTGEVKLGLSLNGVDFVFHYASVFQYFPHNRVVSISPVSGSVGGGTPVTVDLVSSYDLNESNDIHCHFGSAEAPANIIKIDMEHVRIMCMAPRHSVSNTSVGLEISFNGQNDITTSSIQYIYYDNPTVTSIMPQFGFTNGGESVAVKGNHFANINTLQCMFGIIAATKTIWISANEVHCVSPPVQKSQKNGVHVVLDKMTGIDDNTLIIYEHKEFPLFHSVNSTIVKPDGSTILSIRGRNLENAISCKIGKFSSDVPVLFSANSAIIICRAPAQNSSSPYINNSVQIFVTFQSTILKTGLFVSYEDHDDPYKVYHESLDDRLHRPIMTKITPYVFDSAGGDWITVKGKHFSNRIGLTCLFHNLAVQKAVFISANEIKCQLPRLIPGSYDVYVTNGSRLESLSSMRIHVTNDAIVTSIHPTSGPLYGNTKVVVKCKFVVRHRNLHPANIVCQFGTVDVPGILQDLHSVVCISPPVLEPKVVELSLSFDAKKSYTKSILFYTYETAPYVKSLNPSYGSVRGGTRVLVEGAFTNSGHLQCRFGSYDEGEAIFVSSKQIICVTSSQLRAQEMYVDVSANGVDYSDSKVSFKFEDPPVIESVFPTSSVSSLNGSRVYVTMTTRILDKAEPYCIFHHSKVKAIILKNRVLECKSPGYFVGTITLSVASGDADDSSFLSNTIEHMFYSPPKIFQTIPRTGNISGRLPLLLLGEGFIKNPGLSCDFNGIVMRASYIRKDLVMCSTPPLLNTTSLTVKVSPSGSDFSSIDGYHFNSMGSCTSGGHYCGYPTTTWNYPTPNGTYSSNGSWNFTLCHPGTFSPRAGGVSCLPCAVGYVCPDFGTIKPVICPPGRVCDGIGLAKPSSSCPKGHYCLSGTKSRIPLTFKSNDNWIIEEETGIATYRNSSDFSLRNRVLPASGTYRLEHAPNRVVFAEQPIPCDVGYYCRNGVGSPISIISNFITPQKCYDGFFCPRGSSSPEGSGPCKTGYYCPSAILAVECPKGHHCPGIANTKPLECQPGTYSNSTRSSSCRLCEIGSICPKWKMFKPQHCPAGFVCDTKGLSVPDKPCTPGFICEEGTSTDDTDSDVDTRPLPCPAGTFCLSGVAQKSTINWLPNQVEGIASPQECLEGYFCEEGSPLPTGICFPGHYCPPGTPYPKQVPVGTFSETGAIVPALCFPGSYAAATGSSQCLPCPAGNSCRGYGVSVPSICDYGTYRSVADSITCKPCPPATYLPFRGGTDISECLPVPPGRVSRNKGVISISSSDPCDGSHVCSSATEGSNQYHHKCSGGYFCSKETTPLSQFQFLCEEGHQCKRGTSRDFKNKDRCPNTHFCPFGTSDSSSSEYHCPRQTTTLSGSGSVRNCNIQYVDVCDKVFVNTQNPGEDNSYYPSHQSLLTSESPSQENAISVDSGEIIALRKILPYKLEGFKVWQNETLEIFRSCPTFDVVKNSTSWLKNKVYLFGRNFRPSITLTCRFRLKLQGSESTPHQFLTKATFIKRTRISCELPSIEDIEDASTNLASENSSCNIKSDGSVFFKSACDKDDDAKCVGSHIKNDRHQQHVSLFVPCTEIEIDTDKCADSPFMGFRINPCFSIELLIDASNDGLKFSGSSTHVPFTADRSLVKSKQYKDYFTPRSEAIFTTIHPAISGFKNTHSTVNLHRLIEASEQMLQDHKALCLDGLLREEDTRMSEAGWIELPFMSQAHLSIDWTHIPRNVIYDEHFKLAIFAIPSRCSDTLCDENKIRVVDEETLPCVKPISLPNWFTNETVDKHQNLNLTVLALDDVILKAEIHLLHGVFLPMSSLFTNTVKVDVVRPQRDKYSDSSNLRKLSPYISWEEREVKKEFIFAARLSADHTRSVSLPLNLPPRWNDLERGRVLLSMNTTHENKTPTIKDDPRTLNPTNAFWDNPFKTTIDAKEKTDAFLETFHGITVDSAGDYDYDMKSIMLPYLPFISNCREFDSYVPLSHAIASQDCKLPSLKESYPDDWWRREFSALPHQDYIKPVGPFDFNLFYPVADWCERKIYCEYEENLDQQDVTPRWFEATTGTTIFSVIRDPVDYHQYTGREGARTSVDDGGGEKYMKSIDLFDTFIPVKLKRIGDNANCGYLCMPRKMTLDISYHQVNKTSKRLVEIVLVLENFDRNSTDSKYELDLKFYPLNYQQLIVKFDYSKNIFLLLFSLIGMFTVAVSFFYWIVVRLTTRIEHPPKLRFGSTLWLIFPQAVSGFFLGLLPILMITVGVTMLLKGYLFFTPLNDIMGFQTIKLHYKDKAMDPQLLAATMQGRLGMAFLAVAIVSICEGSKMFVPKRDSKRERELEMLREKDACKTMVWDATQWKRSNLIFSSILMGLFLVTIVEWSYWSYFGTYIWEVIIFLKILKTIVGIIVDRQMGESLLSAPIMTAMSLVETIVTLSAVDFLDFLLSYVVGFGFLLLERMYISPYQGNALDWLRAKASSTLKISYLLLQKYGIHQGKVDSESSIKKQVAYSQADGTVEPIIDSYGSYCLETLSLLYVPYVIALLMIFRDDIEMPTRYGIKEQDMEYYALFAMLIIPFQIASDIFLQGSLELFHGWKIHDYLIYTRYRFLQRETRWKGFEDSLDECIDESVRTMDHMCFSTQFYMMMTIHVNGIIYIVLGIQMISRAHHNLFGDPATPIILLLVVISVAILKKVLIWISLIIGIWSIRHEDTAWHVNMKEEETFKLPGWDDTKSASHDAFQMNKQMSSDIFRYKFLDYNRSWLIEQLPNVLTPRTLRRSKTFLTNQLARVITTLNDGISSDSDSELSGTKRFETTNISRNATFLLKDWVKEAKRRLMMKDAVQPLIEKAKGTHCQKCLSKKFLNIRTQISLDVMDASFKLEYPGNEFDRGLWKQFWFRHQTYHTQCLPCISSQKDAARRKETGEEPNHNWGPILLDDVNTKILTSWYNDAQQKIFGKDGKPRAKVALEVSDDDDDNLNFPWSKDRVHLNASSSTVARTWLRTARAQMQQRTDQEY